VRALTPHVSRLQVRPETLVVEKEVARAQAFFKWFVVSRTPGNPAVSTLAVTLVQPAKREALVHKSLSDKEKGALRIGGSAASPPRAGRSPAAPGA
jgi:hypothetical protein